ncbi:serine/threonine-protein kinase ppk15-like isoform X1 [Malania oleifera]|uniref:serine/threonine-protein kinase ppk15-like isoform X1 n=2 Tax=Malania oleifera TaxID=397392 RepID=UPI0025ADFA1B|nr:serine/threonine-protein kinase ppk15-like isoform X1 [Malania oleifera]
MAVSDVEAVLEFLRKNGFSEAESALREDFFEKSELGCFDFERFMFPMAPAPPPLRIPATGRLSETNSSSDDEFVSVDSSASDAYSSEFTNPYGRRSATQFTSETSSDRLSEFGTARDYPDFDMQNDLHWYGDKDETYLMPPSYGEPDFLGCPSEDKFVMTSETVRKFENPLILSHKLEEFHTLSSMNYLDDLCLYNNNSKNNGNEVRVTDYYQMNEKTQPKGVEGELDDSSAYTCLGLNDQQFKVVGKSPTECDSVSKQRINENSNYSIKRSSTNDCIGEFKRTPEAHDQVYEKDLQLNRNGGYDVKSGKELVEESLELEAGTDEEDVAADELPVCNPSEDEYEVFNLRIIHRKNRTGFEENKDFPIVPNTIVGGRYYVTEYLGSAAFSKVVQAHDLHTGMNVCLKIIKNDKDFFDQSLDEIKLLKFVNKHDPADERHILRLFDYFYFQEHLFIVCELLRANLYEFQKFNQDSGGEAYFTLSRLQVIARQCLEALEYLHQLGIIHCDLKPENILIKSYRRCEIKVIDLGSSCFQTDNLCLYVQSRSYRAPEVILGLPYDQRIDIWSLGCILAELCSGEVLFPNDGIVMLLARMIGMLGPIDLDMLVMGQETHKYFTKEYDLYYMNEEANQLEYIVPEEPSLEDHLQVSDTGFINFIRDLLEINPQRRPTAREALEHPWLTHPYDSDFS